MSSKCWTRLSKISPDNRENVVQSGSVKTERAASIFTKEKGSLSLMSVDVPQIRASKSLPNYFSSRYSSGVVNTGIIADSSMRNLLKFYNISKICIINT